MLADSAPFHRHGPGLGDRLDTSVREIMRPGVIMLADDASVVQAQRGLLAHGVHAILVLERGSGRAVGWITTRGLLPWCDRDTGLSHAADAVTELPVFIEPSATAREALGPHQRPARKGTFREAELAALVSRLSAAGAGRRTTP